MSDVSALNQGQIIAMLGAASLTLQSNLHGLSGRVLTWHPEPTAWCIQQVLGHVIETEQTGFAGRIRTMLERSDPHLAASQPLARVLTRRNCWTSSSRCGLAASPSWKDCATSTWYVVAGIRISAMCLSSTCCTNGCTTITTTSGR